MGELPRREEEMPDLHIPEPYERVKHIIEELNIIEKMIRKDD